jgi:hypothetical protein
MWFHDAEQRSGACRIEHWADRQRRRRSRGSTSARTWVPSTTIMSPPMTCARPTNRSSFGRQRHQDAGAGPRAASGDDGGRHHRVGPDDAGRHRASGKRNHLATTVWQLPPSTWAGRQVAQRSTEALDRKEAARGGGLPRAAQVSLKPRPRRSQFPLAVDGCRGSARAHAKPSSAGKWHLQTCKLMFRVP